uniref:Dipeptidase n=1 Tax=Strigamia maritima TaxID=126957 RepID=T1JHS0_STRMM
MSLLRFLANVPYFFGNNDMPDNSIEQAFNEKRISSLIGVEGGHSMGNSLAVLRIFYELGVRYMTLTHNCHTLWAESHIGDRELSSEHPGLSDFGKLVVKEMNRLGMLVDLAHVSMATMSDALDISRAPVIFSHSSAYKLCNSTRNVRDSILKRVMENGGIVMVNFYNFYISCGDTANISQVA